MISSYYFVCKINKLKNFCESKAFFYWSLTLTFALHVLISSCTDIGSDTAIYIDIGRKMANGGKFYTEIFESNLPYNFYLYALQYKIYQWTGINRVLMSIFFVWLIFFITLCFAVKFFKNTKLSENKLASNIFFLTFFLAFLLRTPSIIFFEIGTKSTYLMLSLFLYLILSLEMKQELTKSTLICRGFLMAIMPFLKVFYVIFPMLIELYRLYNARSWLFFKRTDIVWGLIFGLISLNITIYTQPNYFVYMVPLWSAIYPPYQSLQNYLINIKSFFNFSSVPVFIILVISLCRIEKFEHDLKIFIIILISSFFLILFEGLVSNDQTSIFYFCSYFFIFYIFLNKEFLDLLNLSRNIFSILALFLIFSTVISSILFIIYSLNYIFLVMWFIAPFTYYFLYKYDKENALRILRFGLINLLFFGLFVICIKDYLIKNVLHDLVIILNNIYWIMIFSYYEKKINSLKSPVFSRVSFFILTFSSMFVFIFLGYMILYVFFEKNHTKTPNYNYDRMFRVIKKYAPNRDDHVIISGVNAEKYPLYIHLQKDSLVRTATQFIPIDLKKNTKKNKISNNYIILNDIITNDLIDSIKDPKYKVITLSGYSFVQSNLNFKNSCPIKNIEILFRNQELRDLINKNFEFVGVINLVNKYTTAKTTLIHKNKKIQFDQNLRYFGQQQIFVRKINK
ncbi:MAG: hypothetical protein ACKO47_01945 [Alphaproteobacteria bacterium]